MRRSQSPFFNSLLGQNFADHISEDVGKPVVAAGVAIRQPFVVEAQQMQQRGVQVVDVDTTFFHLEPELVGHTVAHSRFDAAAREEGRKAFRLMLAAVRLDRGRP